jgi:hypothetical protein
MNDVNNEQQNNQKLEQKETTKKSETKKEKEEEDQDLVYERVKKSRFKQQRLPAWRPVPTILSIIIIFAVFGVVFIALGVIVLIYSKKVKSYEVDYTDCLLVSDPSYDSNNPCIQTITINEDIEKPIFVYYQLDGFFQNTRRYVKSKEVNQLTGDDFDSHENCDPAVYNKQMDIDYIGLGLNPDSVAIPCGLMAKTFFNDSYTFKIKNGNNIDIDYNGIAFDKDKELFYKNPTSGNWLDMEDERFLVWMRPSGLPNPRKLWGKINQDLKKDDQIEITITNNYNVNHYDGKKKIVLSNATDLGGKNDFLGISYIVVGGLSLICAIIFPIGYKYQMQKEKNS